MDMRMNEWKCRNHEDLAKHLVCPRGLRGTPVSYLSQSLHHWCAFRLRGFKFLKMGGIVMKPTDQRHRNMDDT